MSGTMRTTTTWMLSSITKAYHLSAFSEVNRGCYLMWKKYATHGRRLGIYERRIERASRAREEEVRRRQHHQSHAAFGNIQSCPCQLYSTDSKIVPRCLKIEPAARRRSFCSAPQCFPAARAQPCCCSRISSRRYHPLLEATRGRPYLPKILPATEKKSNYILGYEHRPQGFPLAIKKAHTPTFSPSLQSSNALRLRCTIPSHLNHVLLLPSLIRGCYIYQRHVQATVLSKGVFR